MVLLSAQGMDVSQIAQVTFTSPDRVRDVLHNVQPRRVRLPVSALALSRPVDHDLPFSTWSLAKLAEFLVAEEWSTITCHEGLRTLLGEQGVSFQVIKTNASWRNRIEAQFTAMRSFALDATDTPATPSRPA